MGPGELLKFDMRHEGILEVTCDIIISQNRHMTLGTPVKVPMSVSKQNQHCFVPRKLSVSKRCSLQVAGLRDNWFPQALVNDHWALHLKA